MSLFVCVLGCYIIKIEKNTHFIKHPYYFENMQKQALNSADICNEVKTNKEIKKKALADIQKRIWVDKLKSISIHLDIYTKQMIRAEKSLCVSNIIDGVDLLYPFPMFEYIINSGSYSIDSNQIDVVKRCMPTSFHTLYAEAEILKMLISE
jgi:hypothetical protein